ncbi:peroxiredoxin family protein [Candidatus Latescibacterota bacterium]
MVGRRAKDFVLSDCNGEEVSLKSLRGRVVVLTFVGTWSEQCRKHLERVEIVDNANRAEGKDVVILAITAEKDRDLIRDFVKENDYSFAMLTGGREVFKLFQVGGIPDTFSIDKRGIIRSRIVGLKADNEQNIDTTTLKLLNKKVTSSD